MVSTQDLPEIQEWQLSPDKLWDVQQSRRIAQIRIDWGLAGATALMVSAVIIQPINEGLRNAIKWAQGTRQQAQENAAKVNAAIDYFSPDWEAEPKRGESILGYQVTSGFGPRNVEGCPECSRFHRGLDVATPVGVQLYAIGKPGETVTVECKEDSASGKWAAVRSPSFPNLSFEYLHLSKCAAGSQPAGSVIALTGDSGIGTGEHLHLQVRELSKQDNETRGLKAVPKWVAFWALSGSPPSDPIGRNKPAPTGTSDTVYRVFSGKEIGSAVAIAPRKLITNYHVVQESATGKAELFVRDASSNRITGSISKVDEASDLALIELDKDVSPTQLAEAPPQKGETIKIIGNPAGNLTTIAGTLTDTTDRLKFSAQVVPGFSGGAVLNQYGQLIGITRSCQSDKSGKCRGEGYAIPLAVIRRFAG